MLEDKAKLEAILEGIAKDCLDIPTLQTRNSDHFDFYDCNVGAIRAALLDAYRAGQDSVRDQNKG